jgi:hypothetical protein
MPSASKKPRRRRSGAGTLADVEHALVPFRRPSPRNPYDVPAALKVTECRLGMVSQSLEFTLSAKAKLAKYLPGTPGQIDDALNWLADDLKWAFHEEFHHARRHSKRQLERALLALARLHSASPIPALPDAFLHAVESAERRRASGALLPHDVPHSIVRAEFDVDELMVSWRSPTSIDELSRLADGLFRAVRKRRVSNWEQLAVLNTRWDPLHQAVVECACRTWIAQLGQPAVADTRLVAMVVDLLTLIDGGYRATSNDKSVDAVRSAITAAFRDLLTRKKCA